MWAKWKRSGARVGAGEKASPPSGQAAGQQRHEMWRRALNRLIPQMHRTGVFEPFSQEDQYKQNKVGKKD